MAHLEERTPFEPPTIEETGGAAISSINDGAVSLRYRSYTPSSTVSTTPVAGQRIVFLVQSSDYEQLLANKCYLRLPLKMAADAEARITSLAPLAMLASAQLRINGQVVQSVDNVYETACFNLRTKTNYSKIAESAGGWFYPTRQGQKLEQVGSDVADGIAGTGTSPTLAAGVTTADDIRDNVVLPVITGLKLEQLKYLTSDRMSALQAKKCQDDGGADFILPLGLIFGICSEAQDFAIPKAEVEISFVVHSDFQKRVNAGVDLSERVNAVAFEKEQAVTFNAGAVALFAAMAIPLDFKGSAGQSFLYECPHWSVDTFVPQSADHTAQISVAPSTYKAMVAVQQPNVNTNTRSALNDWRASYEGVNQDTTTNAAVPFGITGAADAACLFLNRNKTNSKAHALQECEARLGSARAPDRPYDLSWADDGTAKSDVQRAYLDHVASNHGVLVGDGIESFDDWMDYGAILSFPLIRPHDERSSMMTVRTKFRGDGSTTEKEFVDRRVLVYTMSRRNVVLDYSSSENASVQVDDSV
eukprot:SAG11_NODE_268_length_11447_cov_3.136135_7_plen_531_part_00